MKYQPKTQKRVRINSSILWLGATQLFTIIGVWATSAGGQAFRFFALGSIATAMLVSLLVSLEAALTAMILFEPFHGFLRRAQYLLVPYSNSEPIHLLTPLVTFAAFLFLLQRQKLEIFRASPLAGTVSILAAIYFVVMSLLDGQKLAVYLIYIVPFYSALLSIWLYHMWEKRRIPLPLLILGVSGFILLQTGGIALRIKQNTYGNYYLPAVEYLNQTAADDELIMGSAELRFALKPSANTIADGRFAFYTGKRPEYIVYDPGIEDSWKDSKIFFPEFYEYFPRLLKEEYRIAYENTAFKVYVRR